MDTLTIILILGIAAQALAVAAIILAPPLYAWTGDSHFGRSRARRKATCDYRWLDRTHAGTAHEHRD